MGDAGEMKVRDGVRRGSKSTSRGLMRVSEGR